MQLIATTDFHYGLPRADGTYPVVLRGQAFDVLATADATAAERYKYLKYHGTGVTPEDWEKRSAKSDESHAWAKAEVARMNGLRA